MNAFERTSIQGIVWIGDYIYVNNHESVHRGAALDIYEWTGDLFIGVERLLPPSEYCTQGIGKEPGEDVMWWTERAYGSGNVAGNVVKSTIEYD